MCIKTQHPTRKAIEFSQKYTMIFFGSILGFLRFAEKCLGGLPPHLNLNLPFLVFLGVLVLFFLFSFCCHQETTKAHLPQFQRVLGLSSAKTPFFKCFSFSFFFIFFFFSFFFLLHFFFFFLLLFSFLFNFIFSLSLFFISPLSSNSCFFFLNSSLLAYFLFIFLVFSVLFFCPDPFLRPPFLKLMLLS